MSPRRKTASTKLPKAVVRRKTKNGGGAKNSGKETVREKEWPVMYQGEHVDIIGFGRSKFGRLTAAIYPLLSSMSNILDSAGYVLVDPPEEFSKKECQQQLRHLEERYIEKHEEFKVALENELKGIVQKWGTNDFGRVDWSPFFNMDTREGEASMRQFGSLLDWCRDASIIKFTKGNIYQIYRYSDNFHCFQDYIDAIVL